MGATGKNCRGSTLSWYHHPSRPAGRHKSLVTFAKLHPIKRRRSDRVCASIRPGSCTGEFARGSRGFKISPSHPVAWELKLAGTKRQFVKRWAVDHGMPMAMYPPTQPPEHSGASSIVEQAKGVLQEQNESQQDGARTVPVSRWDQGQLPILSDVEKQLSGFRQQALDLVDSLTRLFEHAPSVWGDTSTPNAEQTFTNEGGVPSLRAGRAIAGQVASAAFRISNEAGPAAAVVLRATSLVSERGVEIPGHQVSFEPSSLDLASGGEAPVKITLRIPEWVPEGTYAGLVQAAGLPGARAVLVLDVESDRGNKGGP